MKLKNILKRVVYDFTFNTQLIGSVAFLVLVPSCNDFLEVTMPKSKVHSTMVFSTDVTAESAVTGIYNEMLSNTSFASGSNQSITALCGLSSDELVYLTDLVPQNVEFEENNLTETNPYILALWSSMYKIVYQSNALLEGLEKSSEITPAAHKQFKGEAHFIRAFAHFYLANAFGDIPLVTSTDYIKNASIARTSTETVYEQIVSDLLIAQTSLQDGYWTTERIRPNKATATALLARVYLYMQNWNGAEAEATSLIANNAMYQLAPDLNAVFLKSSKEAIWQLLPKTSDGINGCTHEGYFFAPSSVAIFNVLRHDFITTFEPGDARLSHWVGATTSNDTPIYYPTKYKQNSVGPLTEYSMVFRLAEQYLIRAEARLQLGDIQNAIADVDAIRTRASLASISVTNPDIQPSDLMMAISQERKAELFTEWGHRWFDLKRTNSINEILSPLKSAWSPNDKLYPIPQSEFNTNPNLGEQNAGY